MHDRRSGRAGRVDAAGRCAGSPAMSFIEGMRPGSSIFDYMFE
jgi:hypothetical protein